MSFLMKETYHYLTSTSSEIVLFEVLFELLLLEPDNSQKSIRIENSKLRNED